MQHVATKNSVQTEAKLPPKEFQHFDIETSVREICSYLMTEHIEQTKKANEKYYEIKEENKKIMRRF